MVHVHVSVTIIASDIQAELEKDMADGMPAVKQLADREYSGMFEYRREDEPLLLKNLIIGTVIPYYWHSNIYIIGTVISISLVQ